jgi:hypothetical protein
MDEAERSTKRAETMRKNNQQGNEWEAVVEEKLVNNLPHNYERQQLHGGRKPDFAIHNDDGELVAFVEVKSHIGETAKPGAQAKSGGQANPHDFQQTMEIIEQAAKQPGGERVIVVTPNGENFFPEPKLKALKESAVNQKVELKILNFAQWDKYMKVLKALVANVPPPSRPASGATKAPAAPTASRPMGPQQSTKGR